MEKFDLRKLKQAEYGKTDVSEFRSYHLSSDIFTPAVWASFITGLPPDKHKIMAPRRWKSQPLERLKQLSVEVGLHKIKGKGKLLKLLGFKKVTHSRENYKKEHVTTIFDHAKHPIAISVPTYNEKESIKFSILNVLQNPKAVI